MLLIDLDPKGPLHVGESIGIDREAVHVHVPSDTLFAACVSAWRDRHGGEEATRRIEAIRANPDVLRLTSAFPRIGSLRLFPMPTGLRLIARDDSALSGKRRKRIAWISEGIFDALISARPVDAWLGDACFVHDGAVWLRPEDATAARKALPASTSRAWRETIVPRVVVDRASNASNLFHSGRVQFAQGAGLWFAAAGAEAAWVSEALEMLQDTGLGGLRSTGHGAFNWRPQEARDWPKASGGYGVTLSRYAPADSGDASAALQVEFSAYQLVTVGGWCVDGQGKPWRRRSVRMVAEGAVLGTGARGALIDVRPEAVVHHPVLRYAFPVLRGVGKEALA